MHRPSCSCHSHNGFLLSPEGLAQREFELDGVDAMAPLRYLDREGSVSGLFEFELSDTQLEEQYRRFLNGS